MRLWRIEQRNFKYIRRGHGNLEQYSPIQFSYPLFACLSVYLSLSLSLAYTRAHTRRQVIIYSLIPVSYTHLDVYKRQVENASGK